MNILFVFFLIIQEGIPDTSGLPLQGQFPQESVSIGGEPIISVGDVLLISAPGVEGLEEKEVFVGRNGRIFLPLVGEIRADLLTPSELEVSIIKALSPYVKSPNVFVVIKESSKNKVCISGEVAKPGVYRFIDGYTIGEAINLAGGAAGHADLDHIYVKRADVEGGNSPAARLGR